jgi:outer membrane immunogenic protein
MRSVHAGLKVVLSTIAVAGGAGAAAAADLSMPQSAPLYAPVSAYNWTGGYLGVQGGFDWNTATTPPDHVANESGGIFGVYGGYNWQANTNWVFGIDASANWDGASGSGTGAVLPTSNSAGPTWKGFVRGRVGYAWDRFMIYGTLGGAMAGYSASTTGPAGSGSATPVGWTIGAGIETAITERWLARLDYSYQNYGSFNVAGSGSFAGGVPVSLSGSTLMAGIAYKF